jgi:hypothetical protein
MQKSTTSLIVSAVGTLCVYTMLFGFPFQGTISSYVHNQQLLKQQKMRYKHEEAMAKLKKDQE